MNRIGQMPIGSIKLASLYSLGVATYYLFKPTEGKEYSDKLTQLNLQLGQIEEKIQKAETRIVETTSKFDKATSERADFEAKKKCYDREKKDWNDYINFGPLRFLTTLTFDDCSKYNKDNPYPNRS